MEREERKWKNKGLLHEVILFFQVAFILDKILIYKINLIKILINFFIFRV